MIRSPHAYERWNYKVMSLKMDDRTISSPTFR